MTAVDPRALGRAALLGTGSGVASVPLTGTPADALVAQRADEPIERRILLAAGARSWLRRAGRITEDAPESPLVAGEETRPACSDTVARRVDHFYSLARAPLLSEALQLIDERGLRLPFGALPRLLTRCHKAHRPGLAAVVGERGRWLATQNRAWRWVLEHRGLPDVPVALDLEAQERTFEEGRLDDRVIALCRIREVEPARARDLLEATWETERSDARALLLSALSVSLSPRDEPFVEAQRSGSTKRLRAEAIELLSRLPDSAFSQRMAARARTILQVQTATPKRLLANPLGKRTAAPSLTIELPDELPPDWVEDGVRDEIKSGFGRKASWAHQVLKRVPPSAWAGTASPGTLIRLFATEDWALLLGVSTAAVESADPAWIPVLWDAWRTMASSDQTQEAYRIGILAELVKVMTPSARSERVHRLLKEGVRGRGTAWQPLLESWDGAWPEDVGRQWLGGLQAAIRRIGGRGDDTEEELAWLRSIPSGARRVPLSVFGDRAPTLPPVGTEGLRSTRRAWQRAIDTFHDLVATRIDFVRDLDGLPPAPLGDSP